MFPLPQHYPLIITLGEKDVHKNLELKELEQLEQLRQNIKEKEAECDVKIKEHNDTIKKMKKIANNKFKELTMDKTALKEKLAKKEADLEKVNKLLQNTTKLEADKKELEDKLKKTEEQIANINKINKELNQQIEKYTNLLDDTREIVKTKENNIKRLTKEKAQLEVSNKELQEQTEKKKGWLW